MESWDVLTDVFLFFRDQYVHLPQVRASKGNASGDGGGIRYHDRVAIRAQLFCVFRFWFSVKFLAAAVTLLMIESRFHH